MEYDGPREEGSSVGTAGKVRGMGGGVVGDEDTGWDGEVGMR